MTRSVTAECLKRRERSVASLALVNITPALAGARTRNRSFKKSPAVKFHTTVVDVVVYL